MHYLLDTNICIYLIKKRPPVVPVTNNTKEFDRIIGLHIENWIDLQ
jgi:predicted nucleic acid-binding protein